MHKDGQCKSVLKHGDWQGQMVWQVPADTFSQHFNDIVVMLKAAAETCSGEPAVVRLQQPCHVFGDIHGNFSDLKYFESLLWPLGVPFTAGTLNSSRAWQKRNILFRHISLAWGLRR